MKRKNSFYFNEVLKDVWKRNLRVGTKLKSILGVMHFGNWRMV